MVGVAIWRKVISVGVVIILKHKKNVTPTKYQKMLLRLIGKIQTNGIVIGDFIITHHSNLATGFFIIAVVGINGI